MKETLLEFEEIERISFSQNHIPQRPLIAPPHPELTPQQKQHISERSSAVQQANQAADMTGLAGHQNHQLMPHKRFGGSVADRVMLFERHPVPIVNNENSKETRTSSGNTVAAGNTVPVANNNSAPPWKNLHQEGVGKVQVKKHFIYSFIIHISFINFIYCFKC